MFYEVLAGREHEPWVELCAHFAPVSGLQLSVPTRISEVMDMVALANRFEALSHPTRLSILRLLAKAPAGLAAGVIADKVDVPATTLSSHLATLTRVGLIGLTKVGRHKIYRLEEGSAEALVAAFRRAVAAELAPHRI